MKGLLGTSVSSAINRPEDESRAASAPPMKALLCLLVGSCSLPGLLWSVKAWLVIAESPFLSRNEESYHINSALEEESSGISILNPGTHKFTPACLFWSR